MAEPELAGVVADRAGGLDHEVTDRRSVYDYLNFLREGFAEASIAWQIGDDRILLALAAVPEASSQPC